MSTCMYFASFVCVQVFGEMDPAKIQWGSAGAEYVVESTGAFTSVEGAGKHKMGESRASFVCHDKRAASFGKRCVPCSKQHSSTAISEQRTKIKNSRKIQQSVVFDWTKIEHCFTFFLPSTIAVLFCIIVECCVQKLSFCMYSFNHFLFVGTIPLDLQFYSTFLFHENNVYGGGGDGSICHARTREHINEKAISTVNSSKPLPTARQRPLNAFLSTKYTNTREAAKNATRGRD